MTKFKLQPDELTQVRKTIELLIKNNCTLGKVDSIYIGEVLRGYKIKFNSKVIPQVLISISVFNYLRAKNYILISSGTGNDTKHIFQLLV